MATGVLPLLLGKWTRLAPFFATARKSYTGTIRFGFATDTFDAEGTPAAEASPLCHDLAQLRTLAEAFHGSMQQVPPVFSAKKIGGTPAYKLARQGKPVEMKPVEIHIHRFNLLSLDGEVAEFEIEVSAGGYVRSVAHELGQMAGCGAHLASLRRTAAGLFTLERSVTKEQLTSAAGTPEMERLLLHAREVLPDLPAVVAPEAALVRLRNGMDVNLPEFSQAPLVKIFSGSRDLTGIGKRVAGTLFHPHLNLT